MLTRTTYRVEHGLDPKLVFTCSTGDVQASSDVFGRVIDRMRLGKYSGNSACPLLTAYSTWGTTAANQRFSASVRLQHGASSGGGDMVDLPTAGSTQPGTKYFGTSAMTTPMASWSTGVLQFGGPDGGSYDLSVAHRYIRMAANVSIPSGTTSTAGTDNLHIQGVIVFAEPQEEPMRDLLSTSTSTST
jgi:hypothetical protein